MRRRQFITLIGGAAVAWPVTALSQQGGMIHRIGFLWDGPTVFADALEAFRQGLRDLGYVDGRNIVIEYRWADGKPERMRALAEELVRLKVDIIMAPSSIYTGVVRQATSTIPIVFMSHADPVRSGHVASLAHPGANVTGLSIMMTETNVKGPGAVQGGHSRALAHCCHLRSSHAVAWTGIESRRGRGFVSGAPNSRGPGSRRHGIQ